MRRTCAVFAGITALLAGAMLVCVAHAAESSLWARKCKSCHDGTQAPSGDSLKEKYGSPDEFAAAVKRKGGPCMNILKNDETAVRKIAEELGIRDSKGKR